MRKDKSKKRIAEHGWEKFVAAQHLYWQEQDPQFFSRTVFKWTAFLNGFSAWLSRVTPEAVEYLGTRALDINTRRRSRIRAPNKCKH